MCRQVVAPGNSVAYGTHRHRNEPSAGCAAGMCGDVNLFLNDPEEKHSAEIEVCKHTRVHAGAQASVQWAHVHYLLQCCCRSWLQSMQVGGKDWHRRH